MLQIKLIVGVILVICFNSIESATYPSHLPRCSYGDTNCIKNAIVHIVAIGKNGLPEINLLPIDPLHVDKIQVIQDGGGPVNLNINFKNVDIIGLTNSVIDKVIGFERDIETSKYEVELSVPRVLLKANYKMKGQILVLPIEGNGKMNISLNDVKASAKFDAVVMVRNGKEYLKIKKLHFNMEPKTVSIYLDNLFNGDKLLGDNMNKFLNENWMDIFNEMKTVLFDASGKVFENLLNNVFAKIPYKNLFLED